MKINQIVSVTHFGIKQYSNVHQVCRVGTGVEE